MQRNKSLVLVECFLLFALTFWAFNSMGMDAPKIAEIKQSNQTLWQFLEQLPRSMEAQVLYGLCLAGSVGMFAHYMMQWLKGEITGSLWKYLVADHPRATLLAVAGVLGASLTSITANVFVTDSGEFVGWLNVLWFGLTQGYAADSVANRGNKGNG